MSRFAICSISLSVLAVVGTLFVPAGAHSAQRSQLERGRYLVDALACADCHTPWHLGPNGPEPDASRGLSGHPADFVMPPAPLLEPGPWMTVVSATNTAWSGPWGVSFTSNLTPDPATGIGKWTPEIFIATIRNGKRLGAGRELLPPMPWPAFATLTDDDLRAVFAYLMSRPPVVNHVPEPIAPAL